MTAPVNFPKVIGIAASGYGAGKTTIADRFKNHGEVYKLPYAMALKSICLDLGWNGEKDEKGRRLLQLMGTDVCRECLDPDYWVRKWNHSFSKFITNHFTDYVICDDLRFENEFENIKKLKGIIIYINRPENLSFIQRILILFFPKKQHSSEGRIKPGDCHFVIENNGTLEELKVKIDNIIKIIKEM